MSRPTKKTIRKMENLLEDYENDKFSKEAAKKGRFKGASYRATHDLASARTQAHETKKLSASLSTEFIPFINERDSLGRIIFPEKLNRTLMTQ